MSFFYVCDTEIANNYNKALALSVIQDNGVNVKPNIEIGVTDLISNEKGKFFKNFYNKGDGGITFDIQVIFKKDVRANRSFNKSPRYYPNNNDFLNWIDYWIKTMTPLYVVTDAIDVKNGLYIITDNSSRKQTTKNYTIWDLEFTSFTGINKVRFKNNNNNALKKVIKNTKKSNKVSLKLLGTYQAKLYNCYFKDNTNLKYSKKKKTFKCVEYLQHILYEEGLLKKKEIDGWYGTKTLNAVKQFQKKNKIKANGIINNKTLSALTGVIILDKKTLGI